MTVLRIAGPVLAALLIAAAAIGIIVVVLGADDTTAFVDLDVGDCFDLPNADEGDGTIDVLAVELRDCDEPHDVEVVEIGDLRDGDDEEAYPGFEAVDQVAATACAGAPVDSDRVGVVPVAPTEETWNSFDGRYVCLAIGVGPLVGSVLDEPAFDG